MKKGAKPPRAKAKLPSAAPQSRITAVEIAAAVVSVLWLVFASGFFMFGARGNDTGTGAQFMMVVLVIFMPVAMIWVAAISTRAMRTMREESRRLQVAIDGIRKATLDQVKSPPNDTTVARKLDEIAAAQRKTESALAVFSTNRAAKHPARANAPEDDLSDDQASLALGTTAEEMQPPLDNADFVRALNFPETAEDEAGFTALRRALKNRETAQLIQAAQDVLTLLSQDGIYMDDLRPDMARPEIWRRFAEGERGPVIAVLGGIRDRSSLALTAGRMKQDAVFRDAAHHFLRRFDNALVHFAENANDSELSALSDTRSARAFMLLGRVAGIFS